jgi:hypothetical protein
MYFLIRMNLLVTAGVIKGSEETLGSETPYLDQDTYISLSHRMQSTYTTKRYEIYGVFLSYLKRKQELRHYDAADRLHNLTICIFC